MIRRFLMVTTCAASLTLAFPALAQLPGVQLDSTRDAADRSPEEIIRAQLNAFNAHSPDMLVANLHDGFAWFAVDSDVMNVEMEGRGTFHQSMVQYFQQVPGARADLEELFVAGDFVTTIERAYWQQDGRELSQASLAIYEIRDGLIYRVWYYPAFE